MGLEQVKPMHPAVLLYMLCVWLLISASGAVLRKQHPLLAHSPARVMGVNDQPLHPWCLQHADAQSVELDRSSVGPFPPLMLRIATPGAERESHAAADWCRTKTGLARAVARNAIDQPRAGGLL